MAEDKTLPPPASLHTTQTVNNIKNLVPLTLDLQRVQYHTWAELFQVAARAHNVMDHIDDPTISPSDPTVPEAKWKQLDAIVLSWIYGTISQDLLLTIIQPGSSAHDAWLRVKNLFLDNKSARAADLEQQFNHTNLETFPNVNAYCQHLKTLADQLKDVDEKVSDQRLVLQLINDLTLAYDTMGSIISQQSPLPSFLTARSMLMCEEAQHNRHSERRPFLLILALPLPPLLHLSLLIPRLPTLPLVGKTITTAIVVVITATIVVVKTNLAGKIKLVGSLRRHGASLIHRGLLLIPTIGLLLGLCLLAPTPWLLHAPPIQASLAQLHVAPQHKLMQHLSWTTTHRPPSFLRLLVQ